MKSSRVKKSVRSSRIAAPAVAPVVEKQVSVSLNPTRDFTSVQGQQGRVPLDPDSNEQGSIDDRPQPYKKKVNWP